MADGEDRVFYPRPERIFSFLDQLERRGTEDARLPSDITSVQMYSKDDLERPADHNEVWMGDFAAGASGERDGKWYATQLLPRKGNNNTRKTPGGGVWKSKAKPARKASLLKRKFTYVIGRKHTTTPWKMEEYTQVNVNKPKFAICKIFRVSPTEETSEGTPSATVPTTEPPSEGTAVGAQVGINYQVRPMETSRGAVFDEPSNFPPSIQRDALSFHPDQSNRTTKETLDGLRSMPIYSPMSIPWQQTPFDTYHGPFPNQYTNPEDVCNGGNVTSDLDYSLLPPQDASGWLGNSMK